MFGPSGGQGVLGLASRAGVATALFRQFPPIINTAEPTFTFHRFVFRSSAVGYLKSRAQGWAIG